MLYMIIGASIVFYLAMTHVTYKYTLRIKRAWFGDNVNTTYDTALCFLWPISFLTFYLVFHSQIKKVNRGEDWADENLNESIREDFRNKYMRKEAI